MFTGILKFFRPRLSSRLLIKELEYDLRRDFKEEVFLFEEVAGVVQGLVNAVGWAALNSTNEQNYVTSLKLFSDFSSKWMKREEVITEIESASGLSPKMCEYALQVLTKRITSKAYMVKAINIEHLGNLTFIERELYELELSEELRLSPPHKELVLPNQQPPILGR